MPTFQFGIQKQTQNNGKEIFIPVAREYRRLFPMRWNRIIKLYNTYVLQELDFDPQLTHEQCVEHINGFKEVLRTKVENNILTTEVETIESTKL